MRPLISAILICSLLVQSLLAVMVFDCHPSCNAAAVACCCCSGEAPAGDDSAGQCACGTTESPAPPAPTGDQNDRPIERIASDLLLTSTFMTPPPAPAFIAASCGDRAQGQDLSSIQSRLCIWRI